MWVMIAVLVLYIIYIQFFKGKTPGLKPNEEITTTDGDEKTSALDITHAYKQKWLMSYNEKDAFLKIKAVADKYGLHVFTKVRLLDLLEPQKGNKKYKTFFYKVQAKHVDFVICDEKLVAKCVIELDDNSHNDPDRQERDSFVDQVLKSVGYQILHYRAINPEDLNQQFIRIFSLILSQ